MSKTVRLEVSDTGNCTANLVLLFNAWLDYAANEAGLSPLGARRLTSVFEQESKVSKETAA